MIGASLSSRYVPQMRSMSFGDGGRSASVGGDGGVKVIFSACAGWLLLPPRAPSDVTRL